MLIPKACATFVNTFMCCIKLKMDVKCCNNLILFSEYQHKVFTCLSNSILFFPGIFFRPLARDCSAYQNDRIKWLVLRFQFTTYESYVFGYSFILSKQTLTVRQHFILLCKIRIMSPLILELSKRLSDLTPVSFCLAQCLAENVPLSSSMYFLL